MKPQFQTRERAAIAQAIAHDFYAAVSGPGDTSVCRLRPGELHFGKGVMDGISEQVESCP